MDFAKRELLLDLYENGFIETVFNARDPERRRTGWTLKSGLWSPLYVNLRPLGSHPRLAWEVARAMALLVRECCPEATALLGIDMAGIPLAASLSSVLLLEHRRELPLLYTRPLPTGGKIRTGEEARKRLAEIAAGEGIGGWGGHRLVEGWLSDGDRLLLIDDVATSFGSKEIAAEWLRHEAAARKVDARCLGAAVVIDREQGAAEQAKALGLSFFGLFRLKTEVLPLLGEAIPAEQARFLAAYQARPEDFQDPVARRQALDSVVGEGP